MIQLLVTWVALTVGFFVASKLLRGFQVKGGLADHLVVSAIFGALLVLVSWLFSSYVRVDSLAIGALVPFLIQLAVMTGLILVTDRLTGRLKVKSTSIAFFAALIVAIVGAVTQQVLSRVL